jgi:hydrogenase maturation factor
VSGGSHCDDGHCVTCSDEGIPMRVLGRQPDGVTLCADESGAEAAVMTDLVEPVEAGDLVLVHAGVALTRLEGAAA